MFRTKTGRPALLDAVRMPAQLHVVTLENPCEDDGAMSECEPSETSRINLRKFRQTHLFSSRNHVGVLVTPSFTAGFF